MKVPGISVPESVLMVLVVVWVVVLVVVLNLLQLVLKNGLVLLFHWFVESLVRLQLKTLYLYNL